MVEARRHDIICTLPFFMVNKKLRSGVRRARGEFVCILIQVHSLAKATTSKRCSQTLCQAIWTVCCLNACDRWQVWRRACEAGADVLHSVISNVLNLSTEGLLAFHEAHMKESVHGTLAVVGAMFLEVLCPGHAALGEIATPSNG